MKLIEVTAAPGEKSGFDYVRLSVNLMIIITVVLLEDDLHFLVLTSFYRIPRKQNRGWKDKRYICNKVTPVCYRGRQRSPIFSCYDPDIPTSFASCTFIAFYIHARLFKVPSRF